MKRKEKEREEDSSDKQGNWNAETLWLTHNKGTY